MTKLLMHDLNIAPLCTTNSKTKLTSITELPSCKYQDATSHNYHHTYIASIIDEALALLPSYKYKLLDVKFHNLIKGEVPCIPGWHVDGGFQSPSDYILFAFGVSHTEFFLEQFQFPAAHTMRQFCQNLSAHIGEQVSLTAQDNCFIRYNNTVPHRGQPALSNGPRLLIRLMGTDIFIPEIKDFKLTRKKS